MNLPGSEIGFENGNFGVVATNPDGICVIVSSATANGTFILNKHYVIYSLKDAELLGILPTIANYEFHKTIREFYDEAGDGTELWIYGVDKTKNLDELVDASEIVLTASNRRIRFVILKYAPSNPDNDTTNGLITGFKDTVHKAQLMADDFTKNKIHPVNYIIEAYNYTGVAQDLEGFAAENFNRVRVLIGDTETRSGVTASRGAAVGVYGGTLARIQVHRNAGRTKNGALKPLQFYIVDTPAEQVNIVPLYEKKFNTVCTRVGKTGFYFVDDLMACTSEDDYCYGPQRRVIDKGYVLANSTLVNYTLDDFDFVDGGKLSPLDAKTIAAEIERVIKQEMTDNGELSKDKTDPNDTGCQALVDTTNNVATTGIIKGKIKLHSKIYGRFLEFTIGYSINT